jgi:hypothetical protein
MTEPAPPFLREDVEAVFFHRPPLLKSKDERGASILEALGRGLGTLLRRREMHAPQAYLSRGDGEGGLWARSHLLRGLLFSGVHVVDFQEVDPAECASLQEQAVAQHIPLVCHVQDHPEGEGLQLAITFLNESLSSGVEEALITCVEERRYLVEPGTLTLAHVS